MGGPRTDKPKAERRHRATIKFLYGLSSDDYEASLKQQGHCCAVCQDPETVNQSGTLRRLSVDHDHLTGKIRGLLCQRCNAAIGLARDEPEMLWKMAEYLAASR